MTHRDNGDPQINFLPRHLHLDSAVLGQPLLGNIQLRHDFNTGNDGIVNLTGRRRKFPQNAIYTIPQPCIPFKNLQMYIACPYLDCLRQYAVHKPYNGRLRGHIPQLLDVFHHLNNGGNGILFFNLVFIQAFE